jgi:hypothetical protein
VPDAVVVELAGAPLPTDTTPAVPKARASPPRTAPPKPAVPTAPRARAGPASQPASVSPALNEGHFAEGEPMADTTPPDNSPMPPLSGLFSPTDRRGRPMPLLRRVRTSLSESPKSTYSGLLATLVRGAREARETIGPHSRRSLSQRRCPTSIRAQGDRASSSRSKVGRRMTPYVSSPTSSRITRQDHSRPRCANPVGGEEL